MTTLTMRMFAGAAGRELARIQAGRDGHGQAGVDAQNPNGALHLYESVGFSKFETWLTYVKNVA